MRVKEILLSNTKHVPKPVESTTLILKNRQDTSVIRHQAWDGSCRKEDVTDGEEKVSSERF